MNLVLPEPIQKLIDQRVRSGRYRSAEDVIAAAIANFEQQERVASLSSADLEKVFPGIRQKLSDGLASARAGKLSDGEKFFKELP